MGGLGSRRPWAVMGSGFGLSPHYFSLDSLAAIRVLELTGPEK